MANYQADTFTQLPSAGEYGNKSTIHGRVADVSAMGATVGAGLAALDTLDLVRLPAGAKILSGFLACTAAITTATYTVGVRYADGTSTGGTTGTAVLLGVTSFNTAAYAVPFGVGTIRNVSSYDADIIIYATQVGTAGPGASAGLGLDCVVDYIASGTR